MHARCVTMPKGKAAKVSPHTFPQQTVDAILIQVQRCMEQHRRAHPQPTPPIACAVCDREIAVPDDAYFDPIATGYFDCWFCSKTHCEAWYADTN